MTKRQRQSRIREVQKELLARMQERFPQVELLETEQWPTGMVVFDVYAPYDDCIDVLESVADRMVELGEKESLHIAIVPVRERPVTKSAHRAA